MSVLYKEISLRGDKFILLFILCCALLSGGFVVYSKADSQALQGGTIRIPATQDTFVDINNANSNYNGNRLEATYSNFTQLNPTRYTLLQFSLASITSPIDAETALVLQLVENNLPASATFDLALYAVLDQWAESTATFATRPSQGQRLQLLTISSTTNGPARFDAPAVYSYLEAERNGDQIASFLLYIEAADGTPGFAGSVLFEDREGSHDGINGNEPHLEQSVDITTPTMTPTVTGTPTESTQIPSTPTSTPTLTGTMPTATATATPLPLTATATTGETTTPAATLTTTPTSSSTVQTPTPPKTPFVTATATVITTVNLTPTPTPVSVIHLPIIYR